MATATKLGVDTARKAFVATLVVVGVVVLALALWKIRLVVALLFAGFIVAAAIRPTIESLHRRGIPRGVGLFLPLRRLRGRDRAWRCGSRYRARRTR